MTFLGLDVGHTVVKAVVHDSAGRVIASSAVAAPGSRPHPHWHERDMDELWQACAEVLRGVSTSAADLRAIAVTGHGDGLYLIDDAGRPVRPAITATDSRAAPDAQRLGADHERALRLTGQVPAAYGQPALLSWLRDHEPDAWSRSCWALYCKDWIRYRLTGQVATDRSDASAAFLGLGSGHYDPDVLALYELDELAPLLPPVLAGDAVAGELTAQAADETALRAGTPVAAGAHDVHAAVLGMGAAADGDAAAILGTFNINTVAAADARADVRWQARHSPIDGTWLHMSTSPTGTGALDWALARFGAGVSVGDALHCALGDEPLPMFLPFLHGAPRPEHPAGALLELCGWHEPTQMVAAVLRGITYTHRWHTDALADSVPSNGPIHLGGGGAHGGWRQLFADVMRRPVSVAEAEQTGCRGAAMLAARAVGADTAAWTVPSQRVQPRSAAGDRLDAEYARWLVLLDALSSR